MHFLTIRKIATLFQIIFIVEISLKSFVAADGDLPVACYKFSIGSLQSVDYKIVCPIRLYWDTENQLRENASVVTDCCYIKHLQPSSPQFKTIVKDKACPVKPGQPVITSVENLPNLLGFNSIECMTLNLNNMSIAPKGWFAELNNVKRLDLRWNQLKYSRRILEKVTNLTSLDIASNNLPELSVDFLGNLRKVTRLNFSFNYLTNLTEESFKGLVALKQLDLSQNNITSLSEDTFSLLENLTIINLSGNRFHSLPEGLFTVNENLSSFSLFGNKAQLKQLPARFLSNLPHLREVFLGCGLTSIDPKIFARSENIRKIWLFGNNLTVLPSMLFADQDNLFELILKQNHLTSLPDDIFQNLVNLSVLELSHNLLTEISSEIFSPLKNLERLSMDNNRLLRISPTAFYHFQKLTQIDLHNNRLNFGHFEHKYEPTSWQYAINRFKQLSRFGLSLNLKNNSFQTMPRSWNNNQLDLSFNDISVVTLGGLVDFGSDKYINLTHNSIRTINFKEQFRDSWLSRENYESLGTQTTRVDIGFNPLHCDCRILKFVLFLKGEIGKEKQEDKLGRYLNIHHDYLHCSTPENLKNRLVSKLLPTELLCPLDPEDSKKKLCPIGCHCWVRDFDKTLIVNCSNGGFKTVPPLPLLDPRYSKGIELHMENNKLTNLPLAKTPGYEHTIKLFVSHNNLTKLSLDNLPQNLSTLDISYNNLQGLSGSVLKALDENRISAIYLGKNPFLCNCELEELLRLFRSKPSFFIDRQQVQCDGNGKKFQDLSFSSICPQKQRFIIAASTIIAALGLLLGILIALFYKYNREIKIWLYAKNMYNWCLDDLEIDMDKKYDAFISYSHKDEDFVADHLVPGLENGPTPFKLCLHTRDWIVGHFIPDQILRSVNESRRTIIVISTSFIESIWAQMEFRAAHSAALKERRARLIVILYGELGDIAKLDPELQAYLKMNTYVKWGDPWFWKKLRYAMPHHRSHDSEAQGSLGVESFKMILDQPKKMSALTKSNDEQS